MNVPHKHAPSKSMHMVRSIESTWHLIFFRLDVHIKSHPAELILRDFLFAQASWARVHLQRQSVYFWRRVSFCLYLWHILISLSCTSWDGAFLLLGNSKHDHYTFPTLWSYCTVFEQLWKAASICCISTTYWTSCGCNTCLCCLLCQQIAAWIRLSHYRSLYVVFPTSPYFSNNFHIETITVCMNHVISNSRF